MTHFTRDEKLLMMLYNPGTREGLVHELEVMRLQLTPQERRLNRLTKTVLDKINSMSDAEFDELELYPEI